MITEVPTNMGGDHIAVVGMAGRFPGAAGIDELWELSVRGSIGLTKLTDRREGYVAIRGIVEDVECFDAEYFGVPEREAKLLDPQQRLLLEVAHHAFEDAAIDYTRTDNVAVYAACAPHRYENGGASLSEQYERQLAGEAGFTAMRLAYRLGLRGESITVETACSSSLTAVHLACQSLLSGQADLVLAGGVSVPPVQDEGYQLETGMITSPSGSCRPFDLDADGTVPGAGAGAVVLKRLEDAERDGDRVRAVILGTAANNDGGTKLGFMAPSAEGQAEVIATAHAVSGVKAGSIGYVETHGTATLLGDAIEIEGLRRGFEVDGYRGAACALGSLKANCGHLDRAAGVAGLIRAVLALQHRTIPPMAGFRKPNPELKLAEAGFEVPIEATQWPVGQRPRRAGISAFGVGGTNVHVVLEEAPPTVGQVKVTGQDSEPVLLSVSGTTPDAVVRQAAALADYLDDHGDEDLAGIANTLLTGRRARELRAFVVASNTAEAVAELRRLSRPARRPPAQQQTIVFAFPGQGAVTVDGLPALYETEPVYRRAIDHHAEILHGLTGGDLHADLFGDPEQRVEVFSDVSRFQPAMVAVELALAKLWASWGIVPDVVLGHSLGEVAAAACAGVLTTEAALKLVVRRAQLMRDTQPGANLSVAIGAAQLVESLPDGITISAINGAHLTTVTGPTSQITEFATTLAAQGTWVKRLPIHISSHSPAMATAAEGLFAFAAELPMSVPRLRMLSNITGHWIDQRISTPDYWRDHLLSQVRFADQIELVGRLPGAVVITMGPDSGLNRMIAQEIGAEVGDVLPSTADVASQAAQRSAALRAAGMLWSKGANVDLGHLMRAAPRSRLPLTPFDHTRRWGSPRVAAASTSASRSAVRQSDPAAWLYEPRFSPSPASAQRTRKRDIAWIGGNEVLRAAIGEATGLDIEEGMPHAADRSGAVDVLWWIGGSDSNLLIDASKTARRLTSEHRGGHIWLLTPCAEPSSGRLSTLDLAVAAARVLPQEFPGISCHVVLLDGPPPETAPRIVAALNEDHQPTILSIGPDGPHDLVFERAWPDWRARTLRPHGCYVITGGLGPVGQALAIAIAREVTAKIVLLGRRPLDMQHHEFGALATTLERLGSTAAYRSVDVTQPSQVSDAFKALRAQYGRIAGVIHAAGFTDRKEFVLCEEATPEVVETISAAKVLGCANIADALTEDDADFVLLCSSLSVVLGGIRFGPYAAANHSLEQFARTRHAAGDRRWIAVGWDAWSDIIAPDAVGPGKYALTPDDGHEVFRRLLAARGPVVTVSTGDLAERIIDVRSDLDGVTPQAHEQSVAHEQRLTPAEAVKAVLLETLGTVPEDGDHDFRNSGVESLAVLQIVTRLHHAAGAKIPLGEAFRALTVNGLVALVERYAGQAPTASTDRSLAVEPENIEEAAHPTTAIQRRWLDLLDERYGGIDLALEVEWNGGAPGLAKAVEQVIRRHSGLRTKFRKNAGGWLQEIGEMQSVNVVDLSSFPHAERDTRLAQLARDIALRWFDVQAVPPFEVTVVAMAPTRQVMLLHAHHVVFDGWSSSIFMRDVALALHSELSGEAPQYINHARERLDYLRSPAAARSIEYWQGHFHAAPAPTRVPPDHQGHDISDRGEKLKLKFGQELNRQLRDRAVTEQTTVFALMMCAYTLLLHSLTGGEEDLIIGTTAAGRPTIESEETVGVFVSPLPLRLRVKRTDSASGLLSSTNDALVGFHEHGDIPLAEIIHSVKAFSGLGLNDTFHCYLLYQNYWRASTDVLRFRPLDIGSATHHRLMREFEIVLEDGPDGLSGELWYLPSRFSSETAHRWGRLFAGLLLNVATGPLDVPVGSLLDSSIQGIGTDRQDVAVGNDTKGPRP
ncbi:SDR family NAD(P)-dependent oxidoreductase [Actinoplanes sp. NPDC051343]|uniref:SDR family NAD(P)-dependent oxidoreductase n=1 Tax=Actinoplanes sp. NPDC051343 TaxID=3363906 RepID=UPI00378CF198